MVVNWVKCFCLFLVMTASGKEAALDLQLSDSELEAVGQRIFQNECNAQASCLVHWNQGESFPSLGIGHFIWYPNGIEPPFVESFPILFEFMVSRGADAPDWLVALSPFTAPWPDRDTFQASQQTQQVLTLRQFMLDTKKLQAEFILARTKASLTRVVTASTSAGQQKIEQRLAALSSTPAGVYALIDYVNFKGEGLSPDESYRGEGWGLLQVLQGMSQSDPGSALDQFRQAATAVLTRRAENSPNQREREQWLPGWLNRVQTYDENGDL